MGVAIQGWCTEASNTAPTAGLSRATYQRGSRLKEVRCRCGSGAWRHRRMRGAPSARNLHLCAACRVRARGGSLSHTGEGSVQACAAAQVCHQPYLQLREVSADEDVAWSRAQRGPQVDGQRRGPGEPPASTRGVARRRQVGGGPHAVDAVCWVSVLTCLPGTGGTTNTADTASEGPAGSAGVRPGAAAVIQQHPRLPDQRSCCSVVGEAAGSPVGNKGAAEASAVGGKACRPRPAAKPASCGARATAQAGLGASVGHRSRMLGCSRRRGYPRRRGCLRLRLIAAIGAAIDSV